MTENTKNKLRDFRDFFWPMLEPERSEEKDYTITLRECSFLSDKNIDLAIQVAQDFAAREEDRRKTVENKASILIGTFSVVITILLSFLKDVISEMDQYPIFFIVIVFFSASAIVVYLSFSTYYATKVLSRDSNGYKTVGIPKFLHDGTRDYKIQLFLKIRNSASSNMQTINNKVNFMAMAYEFFKCAIRAVIFFTIILIIFFIVA